MNVPKEIYTNAGDHINELREMDSIAVRAVA